ncbi:MAG: SUMF1/EgtB/PvdO family nonheme iron enzyme [Planctomycetota bacterium]|nr:SUMF1/EgtB/PvdO family nonheme iron enzyme [Planctomycetota bacterium]
MEARGQANLAPLTRCSSLPLGWLVAEQLGRAWRWPVPASRFFRKRKLGQLGALRAGKAQKNLKTRCPGKNVGLCEAVAVRFWLRDGYVPGGTGVFGFPVRRVASPAEASELRAGRVPRFRFQQPSLSGAIECSHRIESGALPTASPSSFLDHGQQPTQPPLSLGRGPHLSRSYPKAFSLRLAALACLLAVPSFAEPIQWVTVGDPGNTADTAPAGFGAVTTSFQIMKYEFTNQLYTDFLNSVAKTDTYSLYNTFMGSDARGGISRSGSSGSYSYSVKTDMGDKPVTYVSWFDAARVSNWYMNGATSSSSTETGAYTLVSGQVSDTAPAVNPGATFYVPTADQWYKAAYYKGGGTSAGYWNYATQSDSAPTAVTAGSTGIGSAGSTGNFANFDSAADWNSQNGNVTTVGTNGGASAYGAFDMGGNVYEWNDLTGASGSSRGLRSGTFRDNSFALSSASSLSLPTSIESFEIGIRLASEVNSAPVPEIDPAGMGSVLALVTGALGLLERRRQKAS